MSTNANTWFIEQHRDKVTHKFQSEGFLLKGMVTPEGTLEANKAYFPVAGKGSARKKVRGQDAVPMNATKERKEALLETWEAFDEIYMYDLSRMGANERETIAQQGAKALGRAVDAEIMAAMGTLAPTSGTANFLDYSSSGDTFGLVQAMTMGQLLQAQDVPMDGNVWCGLPSLLWNQLMVWPQFSKSDYVGPDLPFKKMGAAVRSWNFVNWVLMPDSYFTAPAAGKVDVFMWHSGALGWANNADIKMPPDFWQWDNRKGCWTIRMESEGAAVGLLPEGIVRGRFRNDTAITIPTNVG